MTAAGRERWRSLRAALGATLFAAVGLLLRLLPRRVAQALGAAVGALAWRAARRDRERALASLALAFPDTAPAERERLGSASFRHLGTSLLECLWLSRRGPSAVREMVAMEGWDHVEAARATGRPLVILTGHCGNWEVLAAALNVWGLPLTVVARAVDQERLNRVLVGLRRRFGTETIERGSPGAPRRLLRTLRSGGALGMLIDQDTDVDGVFVPFFGVPAYTPVGAAEIALRQGAVVLPVFIERAPDGRHHARVEPPLELPDDATAATAAMTATIEDQVRSVPAQWVWMHRRWRRRPPKATPD